MAAIADTLVLSTARSQQQPGVFDTPCRQDKYFCIYRDTPARQCPHRQRLDLAFGVVRFEFAGICLQIHGDVGRRLEFRPIGRAETRRRTELGDPRDEVRAPERQRQFGLYDAPVVWRVIERSDLADLVCSPIPSVQPKASQGPTTIRQTFARFEIDRIKRQAPAAPMIRGATEIAEPASGQIREGPPNNIAGVELLCSAIELHPAAFQQNTGEAGSVEFSGERDTGGPCPDDTDRCPYLSAVRNGPKIDKHAASSSGGSGPVGR